MSNQFLNSLKKETNLEYTENGALVHKTTNSDLLDFFAKGGALRSRSENEIINIFDLAFSENPLLALKTLFYFRDIRGGQGERNTFRIIIKYLANSHTDMLKKNIHLIPYYGRWDDLYSLFNTRLEKDALELFKKQLNEDLESECPSLLGKWLKSENTSSKESRRLGRKTREYLGYTAKEYRKILSQLRKKINIVETLMTSNKWEEIEYSNLPSKAGLQYRNAFRKHDEKRYGEFLESLANGEVKVNSSTLFPYELVRKVDCGYYADRNNDDLYNGMWDNLPNYLEDCEDNSIAVVDVSGSMSGLPMEVAISVGLYLAERNNGSFHNHFITFESNPNLLEVKGSNFCERVRNIMKAPWGGSTNILATFDLILNTAVKNKLPQSEIPSRLFIISDMEFDAARGCGYGYYRNTKSDDRKTLFQRIESKWKAKGYKMPKLVFWNVASRNDISPMTMDDNGVQFVSGCSPSIFTSVMKGEFLSPYDLMLEVINSERYSLVRI